MQVSWARHAGLYVIQTNYTFQKALGVANPTINPFNLSANYGPLPSDRRHLFNAAYSLDLGQRVHSNALLNGLANGWQISGVTQLESGANLTFNAGSSQNITQTNYGMSLTCADTAARKGRRSRVPSICSDHSWLGR